MTFRTILLVHYTAAWPSGYVSTFHKPKSKLIRYEKLLCLRYPFGDVGAIDTEWQRGDKLIVIRDVCYMCPDQSALSFR